MHGITKRTTFRSDCACPDEFGLRFKTQESGLVRALREASRGDMAPTSHPALKAIAPAAPPPRSASARQRRTLCAHSADCSRASRQLRLTPFSRACPDPFPYFASPLLRSFHNPRPSHNFRPPPPKSTHIKHFVATASGFPWHAPSIPPPPPNRQVYYFIGLTPYARPPVPFL